MKKALSLLLALAMLLSLSVTVFANDSVDETPDGLTITLDKSEMNLAGEVGSHSEGLIATVTGSDSGDYAISWSVDNPDIVELTPSKDSQHTQCTIKIKGGVEGNGIITAAVGEKTATCAITVRLDEYTITFNSMGGSDVESQKVKWEGYAVEPEAPTKEGYTFFAWYTSQQGAEKQRSTGKFNFELGKISKDYTLFASWKINKYTVKFVNGGTELSSTKYDYDTAASSITVPANPTKDGYTFIGWSPALAAVTEDVTYTAQWTPKVTVGGTTYDTLTDAVGAVTEETTEFTVNEETTIGSTTVAANSTVTVATETVVTSTDSTATVTPKTVTIAKDGESQTAKAYVVSSGEGNEAKSAVVTDVKLADESGITNDAPVVENLVNVAQVLANAVAANATGVNAIDVSSISSMTLRLDKTDDTASVTLTGNESDVKTALQSKLNNTSVTVYDVKPIAMVTTATTTGTTTSTKTYEYDASKEVTGEFKFKLHVSDNSTDVGKTANLTHYHENNDGTWTATKLSGIVDSNGDVTVTLNQFSYISVDGLEYEVFGEVYDFDAVFGNKNEFNITFLYDESIRDNLDGYAVKLYLDDNGTERELTETSGSDYLNSDITTYKTDGVKTGSSGANYQVFTVKMFAKYFASDIIVKLVKNDEAVNITSYNNSAFGISAEVGTQFGYSMVDFVDLKIAGFNAVSDSANAAKYTTLKSAITAYGGALSALD